MKALKSMIVIADSGVARDHLISVVQEDKWRSTSPIAKSVDSEFYQNTILICHKAAERDAVRMRFDAGLKGSPVQESKRDNVVLLSGSNDVSRELADCISEILISNSSYELIVPQMYALPEDPANLEYESHGQLLIQEKEVTYVFDGSLPSVDRIRKAISSMISNYSVAWMISRNKACVSPIFAVVSTFDGDGWIVAGQSTLFLPAHSIN